MFDYGDKREQIEQKYCFSEAMLGSLGIHRTTTKNKHKQKNKTRMPHHITSKKIIPR